MKRDGSKAPAAIHGPSGLEHHPLQKANMIVGCLKNKFTPHDLCGGNYEWREEDGAQALLKTVDNNPPEGIRPCDIQKLINSLKLRKVCWMDGHSK
jgi:hypothetical protein